MIRPVYFFLFSVLLAIHTRSDPSATALCPPECACSDDGVAVVCKEIERFPDFATPNNLSNFSFVDCRFENATLPKLPESYGNATVLSLRNCSGRVVNGAFDALPRLATLSVIGNSPLDLNASATLPVLAALVNLDLSDNELTALPDDLCASAPRLAKLNVSGNRIGSIAKDALDGCGDRLEYLDVRNNRLTTFAVELQPSHRNYYYLNLAGNPWACDCKMQWVTECQLTVCPRDDTTCDSPAHLAGKNLYDAETDLSCGGRSSVALGIGIPILLVCLLIIGYYLYKIIRSHQARTRLRSSVKYSSVYGETVESNSKQSILA